MYTFKERLQYLIDIKNITQAEVAAGIKMNEARVSDWLSGKVTAPRRKTLNVLSAFFECDIEWLATGKGKPFPKAANRTEMIQTGANGTQAGRDIYARDTHIHKAEEVIHSSAAARHLLEILDKLSNREDLLNRFVFEALQELQKQNEEKKEHK